MGFINAAPAVPAVPIAVPAVPPAVFNKSFVRKRIEALEKAGNYDAANLIRDLMGKLNI